MRFKFFLVDGIIKICRFLEVLLMFVNEKIQKMFYLRGTDQDVFTLIDLALINGFDKIRFDHRIVM